MDKLTPVDAAKALKKLPEKQQEIIKRQAELLVAWTGMLYSDALTVIAAVGMKLAEDISSPD